MLPRTDNNFDLEMGQRSRSKHGNNGKLVTSTMYAKYKCTTINTADDMTKIEDFEIDRCTGQVVK